MKKVFYLFLVVFLAIHFSCSKDEPIEEEIPPAALPVANFNFTYNGEFAPCFVFLTNLSENAVDFHWDFGDGNSSTYESPNLIYYSGGIYNITLTVKNIDGVSSVINKIVTIKDAPTKLRVTGIKLIAMPFTNSNGAGWDSSTGPDVYFKLTDSNNASYFTTETYMDIVPNDLPITFNEPFPLVYTNFNYQYILALYDYDWPSSDDLIGSYYFKIKNWMPTSAYPPYPTILSFSNSTSQLKFDVFVEWLP
jgi:PKD repeat protein